MHLAELRVAGMRRRGDIPASGFQEGDQAVDILLQLAAGCGEEREFGLDEGEVRVNVGGGQAEDGLMVLEQADQL